MEVVLRETEPSDLPLLFAQMRDPEAVRMAAFTTGDPGDRDRFAAYWAGLLASSAVVRTVVADGTVAGSAVVYGPGGEREVAYWIGRAHWGRGVATAALRALLELVPERPLRARAAADNAASLRVLEKCGFTVSGHGRSFAAGRGEDTDEVELTLGPLPPGTPPPAGERLPPGGAAGPRGRRTAGPQDRRTAGPQDRRTAGPQDRRMRIP